MYGDGERLSASSGHGAEVVDLWHRVIQHADVRLSGSDQILTVGVISRNGGLWGTPPDR